MTKLTQESIIKSRQWFAENTRSLARKVKSGEIKINGDVDQYCTKKEKEAMEYLAGVYDHGMALRQRAYSIQTGECPAILP